MLKETLTRTSIEFDEGDVKLIVAALTLCRVVSKSENNKGLNYVRLLPTNFELDKYLQSTRVHHALLVLNVLFCYQTTSAMVSTSR